MSAKHTPGEWMYGVRKDGSIWLSIGDRRVGPHFQGDLIASVDDARLIAASPMLLEALQAILSFIPITSAAEGGASACSANVRAADKVRAAIAAATGEKS